MKWWGPDMRLCACIIDCCAYEQHLAIFWTYHTAVHTLAAVAIPDGICTVTPLYYTYSRLDEMVGT